MYKIVIGLLIFLLFPNLLFSQILPREGRKLNYRIIVFSFPKGQAGCKYTIEISEGKYFGEHIFEDHIINTINCDSNKIISEVPFFGKEYTWRVVYSNNTSAKKKSDFYHFNTGMNANVDTAATRLRIIKNAGMYSDRFFFMDMTKTMYDINGKPVWYLPDSLHGANEPITNVRDLKCTPFGTISFMNGSTIYEVNYNCDILWKKPNGDLRGGHKIRSTYNHEFTRLENGNYMVLSIEDILFKGTIKDTDLSFLPHTDKATSDTSYRPIKLGALIEYDKAGNEVWTWKLSDHARDPMLINTIKDDYLRKGMLCNAFYFDQLNSAVYISYREVSTIIKVKYPEGFVMNIYEGANGLKDNSKSNELFCGQHSPRVSLDGYLYMFNNNDCHAEASSSILVLHEPLTMKDSLQKVWEYNCDLNDFGVAQFKPVGTGGGNVLKMSDGSFFASMGYYFGIIFIVNADKKIIWSAISEKWNTEEKKWELGSKLRVSYRASIIDKNEMDRLVLSQ